MGLFDSLFSFGGSSSNQKKDIAYNKAIADREAVKQGFLSGVALEQGSEAKARLAAAEQARMNLRAKLRGPMPCLGLLPELPLRRLLRPTTFGLTSPETPMQLL